MPHSQRLPGFLLLMLATLGMAWTTAARAQLTVQITQGVVDAIPVAVVPFAWSGSEALPLDAAAVIQADLDRSGRFRSLPRASMIEKPTTAAAVDAADWRLLKVDYVVVGRLLPLPDGRLDMQFELVNALTGQRLLGLALPSDRGGLRMAAHRAADAIHEKILGIRGAFATRIAYVAVAGTAPTRTFSLVVADADGETPRTVARSQQPIMSPAWSPDGQRLAYVSFEGGFSAVYVQTLRTGERVKVSSRAGINGAPAWSPDGTRLALTLSKRDGNADVYVLELATQQLQQLTDDPAIDTEPAWAADGQSVLFTSDRAGAPQVYRLALGGSDRPKRVTFEGSYNARPRLSPDGKQIAVVTIDRGAYRIGVVDLATGALRVLTNGRLDESPSYAPNGAMLIYATREGRTGVLAAVSSDGTVQQRIAAPAGEVREPVWSPYLN